MKADPDEMKENPDEGLQVPEEYLEVFTESPTTKPEVSAPTQAEMEKFYFTTANTKQSLFCWAWYPRFADHFMLHRCKIPICILLTLWGQTTLSVLHYKGG